MICAVTWRGIGEAPRLGCQLSAGVQGGYRLSRRGVLTVEHLAPLGLTAPCIARAERDHRSGPPRESMEISTCPVLCDLRKLTKTTASPSKLF